ncbi:MAG: hypothetical protein GWN00_18115 [Aliifodinibius sp.]|nr:YtxH domain-containing protein [candidate division Zixibacteria bacterium]NIT58067.1 YtxH domain-containing protein [Fodinibius sp.]NIR66132.1 YtxH domain-containing protein [candidate division Zixibacteria bacterium]NIS47753.1 YtxH domain-containing protein [candidate division Zixibacteria bacterium]NIU15859.1 YtxH domain-containing protein [candidate division Zixibacteria bacterium]
MFNRIANFIAGALIGGVTGATLVMLFTPTSGEELREQIQIQIENVKADVQAATAARRAELEAELESLRRPSDMGQDIPLD